MKDMHELYCAGHLIEAAVAHYRATGKRTFLTWPSSMPTTSTTSSARPNATALPGHEEIELALVKLYQVTGQQKYLDLAKFFIDMRGDKAAATASLGATTTRTTCPCGNRARSSATRSARCISTAAWPTWPRTRAIGS